MTLVERNLDLIRKITWSYVRKNPGLEFDDLFSMACIACLEATRKYNPSKGKETTYVFRITHNSIRTILGQAVMKNNNEYCVEEIEVAHEKTPEQEVIAMESWQELLDKMSPMAMAMYEMILTYDGVYLPMDKPRACRGIIVKELREQNWKWNDIWNTFAEIKQLLAC